MTASDERDRPVETSFGETTAPELPAMPLKVVVVAELGPRDPETGLSPEHPGRLAIDRETMDRVLGRLGFVATVAVPDRVRERSEGMRVDVTLDGVSAFRPDRLASSIPATRDLLSMREALSGLLEGKTGMADVRSRLSDLDPGISLVARVRDALASSGSAPPAPPPAAKEPDGDPLETLLASVDSPGAIRDAGGSFDAVVAEIVGADRRGERPPRRAIEGLLAAIDATLSAQVREVLGHPEISRLESAWRGLAFLLDRTDFSEPIRVELVVTGPGSLIETFDRLVFEPESASLSAEPVSVVVVDQPFRNVPEHVAMLASLSERGAALSAPVIASLDAPFLGPLDPSRGERGVSARQVFDGPDYTQWRALRATGPSRWLTVAYNRFLLRAPFEPGVWDSRGFSFVEGGEGCWGNAGWAVAALAVRAFARSGWCVDMMGPRSSGTLEDLHVRPLPGLEGEAKAYPLEAVVTDSIERDLTDAGVLALTAAPGSDRARVRFAPSAHSPAAYQEPADRTRARLQSTLPFQLFVGRVTNYAMIVEAGIDPGTPDGAVAERFDKALRSLLATAGAVPPDAVRVAVGPAEAGSAGREIQLRVRWPGSTLPGAGDVELRWPLSV